MKWRERKWKWRKEMDREKGNGAGDDNEMRRRAGLKSTGQMLLKLTEKRSNCTSKKPPKRQ
jgi:hypothetical protein